MRNNCKPAILITGQSGSGKTTAIRKIISLLGGKCAGFYTQEIRSQGVRVGFEIVTTDGETKALAQNLPVRDSQNVVSFGKYWVNLDALDNIAVPSLIKAMNERKIIVVDEIGPMEIFSEAFCNTLIKILNNNDLSIVGTIVQRPYVFADTVKTHRRVEIITITPDNRDNIPSQIYARLSSK